MVERAQRSLPSGIPLDDYARFYRLGKTKFHNYLKYDTFTGSDMRVLLYMPPNPEEEEASRRLGHYYEIGNLQTITVSTHRPQPAVRTLGRANPKAFGRSVRTTAGTMIFNRVDKDAFTEAWGKCELERPDLVPFFLDQIPPFHIIIHAQNEMGLHASAAFIHVSLTDFGTAFTIEDLVPEQTFCVSEDTQALTADGWKTHQQISAGDLMLTLNPRTLKVEWQAAQAVHRFQYEGEMVHWKNYRGVDYLVTPDHRWLTTDQYHLEQRGFVGSATRFQKTRDIRSGRRLIVGGGAPACFSAEAAHSDEIVELVGWAVTEGTLHFNGEHPYAFSISQSEPANPESTARIRHLSEHFRSAGATATERNGSGPGVRLFYFGRGIAKHILSMIPGKSCSPDFILSLTTEQGVLLRDTMLMGDGHTYRSGTRIFIQNQGPRVDMFQMLCSMLGDRTRCAPRASAPPATVTTIYSSKMVSSVHLIKQPRVPYSGVVWCPQTPNSTWMARRNGCTFWTGNSYKCLYFRPFMDRDNWKHRLEDTISKFEKFEGRSASGLAPLEDLDASIVSDEFADDYKNIYDGGGSREGLD